MHILWFCIEQTQGARLTSKWYNVIWSMFRRNVLSLGFCLEAFFSASRRPLALFNRSCLLAAWPDSFYHVSEEHLWMYTRLSVVTSRRHLHKRRPENVSEFFTQKSLDIKYGY